VGGGGKPSTPDGIGAAMDTESKRQAPLIKEKNIFCKYDCMACDSNFWGAKRVLPVNIIECITIALNLILLTICRCLIRASR
jgi:hypothetical protein